MWAGKQYLKYALLISLRYVQVHFHLHHKLRPSIPGGFLIASYVTQYNFESIQKCLVFEFLPFRLATEFLAPTTDITTFSVYI